jgi:ribose transport system permease protein
MSTPPTADERTALAPRLRRGARSVRAAVAERLRGEALLRLIRDYAIVVSFAALFIGLALASDVFLTKTNLLNVLEQNAPLGIIALALTFVLITGEFDLSVGAIAMLTGVLAATWVDALGVWPALLVAVLCAVGMGVVNGVLVAYAKINSFVCTLSSSLIIGGASLAITKGFLRTVADPAFTDLGLDELGGVKYSIWLFVVAAVLFALVLARSKFGRWLYAVGGNSEAARLSGINVGGVRVAAFAISGLAAGIAGAIIASRTGQGQAGDGIEISLFAFAAVVVGGTSVLGGRGSTWRTVLGVLFLGLIVNGFNLIGVDPIYQQIVQGAIILLAVAADSLSRQR